MGGRYGGNIRSKGPKSAWQLEPATRPATPDEIRQRAQRGGKTVFRSDDWQDRQPGSG